MSTDICRVCGLPVEQHTVELHGGIARAIVRDADGRFLHNCSFLESERQATLAKLATLKSIRQSLRWHATHEEQPALADYADRVEAERARLAAEFEECYPWSAP